MKKALLLILGACIGAYVKAVPAMTQEVRYKCQGAREVYMVWGIDNWQLPAAEAMPEGSFIKDKLVYTPMPALENETFSAKITVNPGTVIDYVFWITRGPLEKGTDIWDLNKLPQKDYHTLAVPNAITLIESDLHVAPKEPLSVLDFAFGLLALAFSACMFTWLWRKYRSKRTLKRTPKLIICCSGLSLLFLLFLIRPSVLGISWDIVSHPLAFLPSIAWAGYYDAIYVGCLMLVFLSVTYLLRKFTAAQYISCAVFVILCLVTLVSSLLNIRVVELLGKPFNYQWLYYSDFLKSPDSQAALSANLSYGYIARIISVCAFWSCLALILLHVFTVFFQRALSRRIGGIFLVLVALAYTVVAPKNIHAQQWTYDRLANPVTAFLVSANPFAPDPGLFTMNVPDTLTFRGAGPGQPTGQPALAGKVKNIVVFVLESTPAEYIDTYGSRYGATPQIRKLESESVTFENIYAHAPATNLSMVSLLGSVYPWLSYNSLTEEHPALPIPTISEELKNKGYRTAFFNSADNRYQKAGEFLAHRKFDLIRDCNESACEGSKFEVDDKKWDFMSGKDDECSGKELTDWIREDTTKPFFALLWTYQTHYPYFFKDKTTLYEPADTALNRYLNALHYGDSVLGNVISGLKAAHLYESTLVLVIGDHGEAFGRHGQISHGRMIYEENLHVPCILINPSLAKERKPGVGGMIDIAPTLMGLLGFNAPDGWQGENLYAKTKRSRAFFFAPWSDYLFGYREGNYKYIYNATRNETEIYDLQADPFESSSIAARLADKVPACHSTLAAWAQYVNRNMDNILSKDKDPVGLQARK